MVWREIPSRSLLIAGKSRATISSQGMALPSVFGGCGVTARDPSGGNGRSSAGGCRRARAGVLSAPLGVRQREPRVGERQTDEWTVTVRAALAKLDAAAARNVELEHQLAAAYADLKSVGDALAEVRAELQHLNGKPR